MADRDDLHQLSGAFALDAIEDEAEAERFARHLQGCEACTREVRGLREVATAMAFGAEEYTPPASMRENVLAAVATTRQLPPVVVPSRTAWWRTGWRGGGFSAWTPRLVAVAAAVAALVFGLQWSSTQSQLSQAQAQGRAIASVLAAPDARVVSGQSAGGGTATAVVAASLNSLVITSAGLPALPAGKVYQLWLIGPPVTRSAGLVPGSGAPVLASGLAAGDKLGLTVEPAGGSRHPTSTPLLLLPV